MAATYRETIAGIDLVVKGDRLVLRRTRESAFQMVVPVGLLGAAVLFVLRIVRLVFHAFWAALGWWLVVLLLMMLCGVMFVHNRRRLVVGRDGTVRQGRRKKAFGPGLRVVAQTQKNNATLLCGESPSLPLQKLGDSPFFPVALEAEWIAVCVNDFLGHARPDGVVEYPRPVT